MTEKTHSSDGGQEEIKNTGSQYHLQRHTPNFLLLGLTTQELCLFSIVPHATNSTFSILALEAIQDLIYSSNRTQRKAFGADAIACSCFFINSNQSH